MLQKEEEEITIPPTYYEQQNDLQKQLHTRYMSEEEKQNYTN
jgi:hypothetical protein